MGLAARKQWQHVLVKGRDRQQVRAPLLLARLPWLLLLLLRITAAVLVAAAAARACCGRQFLLLLLVCHMLLVHFCSPGSQHLKLQLSHCCVT
jgi:hypothetical protein